MEKKLQKLELTWTVKEERARIESSGLQKACGRRLYSSILEDFG